MNKKWIIVIMLVFVLAISTACNDGVEEAEGLVDVTFILDWVPNTNHTGLYVAQEKGFFEEEGLNVTIIEPAMESASQVVASGKAEFGISSQDELTVARSTGIPIVSVAAVIQDHTSGFASPVEKGIMSPADFEGKTYGGWGSPLEEAMIATLMEAEGADPSTVNNITVGTDDFFVNTKREIDFQWIYYGWTGVEAEIRNEDIHMIYLTDIEPVFNYYAPVIMSSEAVIENKPELVEKFLRAVSRGYDFAIAEPEEAASILIEATPDANEELIIASQKWLSPMYKGDAEKWGIQSETIWNNFSEWMLEHGVIEEQVDAKDAMTTQFLP